MPGTVWLVAAAALPKCTSTTTQLYIKTDCSSYKPGHWCVYNREVFALRLCTRCWLNCQYIAYKSHCKLCSTKPAKDV